VSLDKATTAAQGQIRVLVRHLVVVVVVVLARLAQAAQLVTAVRV